MPGDLDFQTRTDRRLAAAKPLLPWTLQPNTISRRTRLRSVRVMIASAVPCRLHASRYVILI
jgi:hypothetical protein